MMAVEERLNAVRVPIKGKAAEDPEWPTSAAAMPQPLTAPVTSKQTLIFAPATMPELVAPSQGSTAAETRAR